MQSKKKIIFFIPTLAGGGAERVVSELSNNMPQGIDQTIVLFTDKVSYVHKGDVVSLGLGSRSSGNLLFKPVEILMRIIRFSRTIDRLKPDVVVSFLQANMINVLVGSYFSRTKYRIVLSERTATMKIDRITKGLYGAVNRFFIRYLYGKADQIVAVSEKIKEDLRKYFGVAEGKITVIYNPVDINRLLVMSREDIEHIWFHERIPIAITVGRLSEQKNHKELIEAFARVRKDMECRLVIIGDGELKGDLTELARKFKIEKDLLIMGFTGNPFKYIARSTVFVLPSIFEGFPNALVEAMAVGCPVLASDCLSGPKEILSPSSDGVSNGDGLIEGEYGMLFQVGDTNALALGMKRFFQEDGLRKKYSESGKKRVMDFETGIIVNKYLNIMFSQEEYVRV